MKDLFDTIPATSKFLEDLGFGSSYTGFRYFSQGHKDEPSEKFMELICDEMEYDYIKIPIKPGSTQDGLIQELEDEFIEDLKKHLEKYKNMPIRTHVKNKTGSSSVSAAVAAFENEADLLDPDKQLDVSELF